MRQLRSAPLAAAVALVFATAAHAAISTASTPSASSTPAPAGTPSLNTQGGSFVMTAPGRPASAAAASSTPSNTTPTTTTNSTPTNTTTVDLRDQQTRAATASTHASGSTSALGPLANGAASANSPTLTAGTGTTTGFGGTLGNPVFSPVYTNPSDVTAGAAAPGSTTTMTNQGFAGADVYAGSSIVASSGLATDEQVNGASVDRAIREVSRERKRVGRNGQFLYSIAPRTNVDRSREMPDDAPSPALTGSSSTLVR